MKRTLQYAFILLLAFVLPSLAHTQAAVRTDGDMTLKSQMEVLHKHFGINFVYDSSLDLDIPYRGEPMKAQLKRGLMTPISNCACMLFPRNISSIIPVQPMISSSLEWLLLHIPIRM